MTSLRRYSLSLVNRTPPKNSLAADILGSKEGQVKQVQQHQVQQVPLVKNSIMSSIKDIKEALSDFNSCQSSLHESCTSSESTDDLKSSQFVNRKKRRRKTKNEFSRGDFIKKQDTKASPK